jgi:hypothetical protein
MIDPGDQLHALFLPAHGAEERDKLLDTLRQTDFTGGAGKRIRMAGEEEGLAPASRRDRPIGISRKFPRAALNNLKSAERPGAHGQMVVHLPTPPGAYLPVWR